MFSGFGIATAILTVVCLVLVVGVVIYVGYRIKKDADE